MSNFATKGTMKHGGKLSKRLKDTARKAAAGKAITKAAPDSPRMKEFEAKMEKRKSKLKMKHGGKYEDGGRKRPLKKLKGAIKKANHKAGAVKNRLEKKVLDAVKRKKAEKGMKYEEGGKLDKGGHATKEYKKQKGKEAKHYRKGMIAKTNAGKSIHRTMRKRATRKAEAVRGKFKDSNEKSNYAYASFKEGGRKEGMKVKKKK